MWPWTLQQLAVTITQATTEWGRKQNRVIGAYLADGNGSWWWEILLAVHPGSSDDNCTNRLRLLLLPLHSPALLGLSIVLHLKQATEDP